MFTLMIPFRWYSYFLVSSKIRSVWSELDILLVGVLSISKFSTRSLKWLLKISSSSSLLLITLVLVFKIINSLWKSLSKKWEAAVVQNVLFSELTL